MRAFFSFLLSGLLLQGVLLSAAVITYPHTTTQNIQIYNLLFGGSGQTGDTNTGTPIEEKVAETINFYAQPHPLNLSAMHDIADGRGFGYIESPTLLLSRKVISPPPEERGN